MDRPPDLPRRCDPLFRLRCPQRLFTDDQLLEDRVEYRAPGLTCAGCRHLGELIRVTELRGARRYRRSCPHRSGGFTDPGWPACAQYERRNS
jgi:hypothetical protein